MHVCPSGFAKFVAKMQRNRIANVANMQRNRIANVFYCTAILFISTGVIFLCENSPFRNFRILILFYFALAVILLMKI